MSSPDKYAGLCAADNELRSATVLRSVVLKGDK